MLDDGKLVVAHAGMKEEMQGRGSGKVRDFALYGETTGETDEFGLPVRYNWAPEYRGQAMVVYGHTPVPEPEWLNRTINIDTGCVFGGKLTALRYPERELVSVPARATYCEPARPFLPLPSAGARAHRTAGARRRARHRGRARQADHRDAPAAATSRSARRTRCAALEVMSRFAANPKWLIYLPPTMSPSRDKPAATGLLEHPAEAFAYYRKQGVAAGRLRGEAHGLAGGRDRLPRRGGGARKRFGVPTGEIGICYTRTGRRFFDDAAPGSGSCSTGSARRSTAAGLWEEFGTDWVCLDCELMPWSAKAQELLRTQYAAVGAAAQPRHCRLRSAALEPLREQRGVSSDGVLDRCPSAGRQGCGRSSRPTGTTAGRSQSARRPASSRPSTCWRPRARSTSTRITSGTWRRWPSSAAADPELLLATAVHGRAT